MASVHNSTIGTLDKGAALTAANNPTGKGFVGLWEDVKDYMTVISTISLTTDQQVDLYFQWSAGSGGEQGTDTVNMAVSPPSESPNIFAYDQFINNLRTYQVPVKARWFRLVCQKTAGNDTFTANIATVYKKTPTEIKITSSDIIADGKVNDSILNINAGGHTSTYTMLTDTHGSALGTTGKTGSALYTSVTDELGYSLATNASYVARVETADDVAVAQSSNGNLGTWIIIDGTHAETKGYIDIINNTFSIPRNVATFRDGDVINFVMYVPILVPKPNLLSDAVSVNDVALNNGVIVVQGTVRVIDTEDKARVVFQLLVDKDLSEWFNPLVGVSFTDPPSQLYIDRNYVVNISNNTYYFNTAHTTVDGATFPMSLSDYYNIIKLFKINNQQYVVLVPGAHVLDLRIYNSCRFYGYYSAAFQLVSVHAKVSVTETLMTSIHNASGANISSTGNNTTQYIYDKELQQRKINIMIDTHSLPEDPSVFDTEQQLTDVCNAFGKTVPNYMQIKSGKLFTTAPAQGIYNIKYTLMVNSNIPDQPTTIQQIQLNNPDDIYVNPTLPNGLVPADFNLSLWGALTYNIFNNTILDGVDTLVLVLGSNSFYLSSQDKFDAIINYALLASLNVIVVTPYLTVDSVNWRALTEIVGGNSDNIITYKDYAELTSDAFLHKIAHRSISSRVENVGHNALAVHPTDSNGVSQGSTDMIYNAEFPGVSMHYALADCSGHIIDTTEYAADRNVTNNSTDLNAMHVCLSIPKRENGVITGYTPVSNQTPMFVYIKDLRGLVSSIDTNISHASLGTPAHIVDSYVDANNLQVQINLNMVGFVNESSVPVWLRLYDINTVGITELKDSIRGAGTANELVWDNVPNKEKKLQNRLAGYDNDGNNYDAANDKLRMNIAVPPEGSRDLKLRMPIKFVDGIHVSGSANYLYTSVDPIGDNHVYMHGTWAPFA